MVGVVKLPENILKKIKISHQMKSCFYTALIVGLLAHLYKITGWIPNWDSLVFRYDPQNMIGLGRWFLPISCAFSSFYDLPFLNGILAIFFTALGAVCIVNIFGIKKDVTAGLIGALTVSFPSVTSVMMYNYVADGYSIAFFLACLSVLFLTKEKPSFVISVILMTLSTAIYQSYISVSAVLLLLYLADEIIFKKTEVKTILIRAVKFAFAGFCGLALYYGILKLILLVSGASLLSYQGVNSAMAMANVNIFASFYVSLNSLKEFFFDFSSGISFWSIINLITAVITFGIFITFIIKNGVYKQRSKLFMLLITVGLIPIGTNIIVFIDPYIAFHNLMKMSYFILYIAFVILYERLEFSSKSFKREKIWIIFIIACLITSNQIVIANTSYHIAQIAYEKSFGTLIRIVDRIEQTENAENCEEILIIGALKGSEAYSFNLPPDITGITESYILRADDESVGQSVMCYSINDYCGKNYNFLYGDKKKEYLNKKEVKEMKMWPHKESVKIVDNVIVLKLGAESE